MTDSLPLRIGVIGDPIGHSRSPLMMNRALAYLGIDGHYGAYVVRPAALETAINGMRALGFAGMNVTIPHKETVCAFLDEIDPVAKAIGAVNTIVVREGKLWGTNTDGIGYVRSLETELGIRVQQRNILLLGAGGAARGIAFALAAQRPASLAIANRTHARAQQLAYALGDILHCDAVAWEDVPDALAHYDTIIHTTSVGMFPHVEAMPLRLDNLRYGTIVSDIVYNPLQTAWLQHASQCGARIHRGLGMFIHQGAYALEQWTGRQAPHAVMYEAVEASLRQ